MLDDEDKLCAITLKQASLRTDMRHVVMEGLAD
jgi:hypothetical protein